jgi:hypothetical protein
MGRHLCIHCARCVLFLLGETVKCERLDCPKKKTGHAYGENSVSRAQLEAVVCLLVCEIWLALLDAGSPEEIVFVVEKT